MNPFRHFRTPRTFATAIGVAIFALSATFSNVAQAAGLGANLMMTKTSEAAFFDAVSEAAAWAFHDIEPAGHDFITDKTIANARIVAGNYLTWRTNFEANAGQLNRNVALGVGVPEDARVLKIPV